MNDTNIDLRLLQYFDRSASLSSSDVESLNQSKVSLVTIKRQLSALNKSGYLDITGAGRSVRYKLSKLGLLNKPFDVDQYLSKDPDSRLKDNNFNFEIFRQPHIELFSKTELQQLDDATKIFENNAKNNDPASTKKELMRFIIEFSWKTSQIEGNTYDLISTEQLLLYGEKSKTNTEFEAQMIINQKMALDFILENLDTWEDIKIGALEHLHGFVADKLGISKNIRKMMVGITGTNYKPLGSEIQIKEALNDLITNINGLKSVYSRALLAVLGVSYIQPFADGNKRTSRLLGNAILLSEGKAPLSYRNVSDRAYKEACLIFYEQNSIEPFKKLFIDQYIFAANNYNIFSDPNK